MRFDASTRRRLLRILEDAGNRRAASQRAIVAAARSMVGTPFVHLGRLPGVGVDCAGLVICVARELGYVPATFDRRGYPFLAQHGVDIFAVLGELLDPVPLAQGCEPGDVLVFELRGAPSHLGIATEGGGLIHAYPSMGRVVESPIDPRRWRRLVAIYRFRGVI